MSHALAGLKPARIRAGISVDVLADRIGITPRAYYRFEEGSRRLMFDKACVLADTLGISVDALRHDPEAAAAGQADTVVSTRMDADVDAQLAGWEAPE